MEDNFFVPLFKENDRTNIVVYRSVKYRKIPVGVPRCKTCKSIHENASSKSGLIAWGGALLFVIVVFMVWGLIGFFAIFVGLFAAVFGSKYLYQKWVGEKQIYTEIDGAKQDPTVRELVINGWSFNQPMA